MTHEALLHAVVIRRLIPTAEAEGRTALDDVGPDVRGHDHHGVSEVHLAAERIGEVSLFHDLQHHVEDVGVGFLHFVEQNHRVRLATHLFGELATFFVPDVTGRRADQTRHGVLLHVLGHVQVDHVLGVTEHEFREGLGEQGLTHTGRSDEEERAHGAVRIFETRTTLADGLGHRGHGVVLADHLAVQFVFELEQTLGFALGQTGQRDAGHLGDDFRDHIRINGARRILQLFTPLGLGVFLLLAQGFCLVADFRGLFVVGVANRFVLGHRELFDLGFEVGQIGWLAHGLQPHASAGFVNHVDRLVGLDPVAHVPARQFDRGPKGVVGDVHLVVLFVTATQSLEDGEGVFFVWGLHRDRLEATLERGILLDVLAVLVKRGGTHALDLAPSHRGLEDIGRVDCTFGTTSTHEGVEFIDEQDDVARTANFIHHGFDAFFELTAVLRARHHHGQVKHHDAAVVQQIWHFFRDDALGQTFHDGRLAHASFPEKNGVVLGAAAEHLHQTFDLFRPANHRVQFILLGQIGEIAAKVVQGRGAALASTWATRGGSARGFAFFAFFEFVGVDVFTVFHGSAQEAKNFFADFFELQTKVHQDLGGHAVLLTEQAEQLVFGANVVVVQASSFVDGVLDDFLGPGGQGQLAQGHHLRTGLHQFFDFDANLAQIDGQALEHIGAHATAFFHQAQQDVFGPDVLVVKALGLLLSKRHHFAGSVCESFKHLQIPFQPGARPS